MPTGQETTSSPPVGKDFAYAAWLRNWARRLSVDTYGLTYAQVRDLLSDEERV
jgi:hypothetical protein